MHLINKMFNDKTIRIVWNKEEEKYYISVVDIVTALIDSKDPRHYWNALKSRLKKEGNETVTNCDQLKLKAQDGKYRSTDVVDIEGLAVTTIRYKSTSKIMEIDSPFLNSGEYEIFYSYVYGTFMSFLDRCSFIAKSRMLPK